MDEEDEKFILRVIDKLDAMGHEVFSAQVRERFGDELLGAAQVTSEDFEEIKMSDLVIAFPGCSPISGGVHIELGWAAALNKPVIIFLRDEQVYSALIYGLDAITVVEYVFFDKWDSDMLVSKVADSVAAFDRHVLGSKDGGEEKEKKLS